MPENMQKKPKVASLDLDAELDYDDVQINQMSAEDIAEIPEDDARYQTALKYLQHGRPVSRIASKLVEDELMESRIEGLRLAQRVLEENPQEQKTNATILLSTAGLFTLGGAILILAGYLYTGFFPPILSPSYLLILIGAWFGYKGYEAWNKAK
ncbi:MAG: hypothetical protein Phog2KO_34940 [Phototrophicaceae bacterium]